MAFTHQAIAVAAAIGNYVFTTGCTNVKTTTTFTFSCKNQNASTKSDVNSVKYIAVGY